MKMKTKPVCTFGGYFIGYLMSKFIQKGSNFWYLKSVLSFLSLKSEKHFLTSCCPQSGFLPQNIHIYQASMFSFIVKVLCWSLHYSVFIFADRENMG